MKKLLCALMFIVCTPLFAAFSAPAPAGYSDLSDAKKAEFAMMIAKAAEQQAAPVVSNIPAAETVSKWANYGTEIGKAISGTAKELGVVANDFIKTPAGQITLYVVIWKVIGSQLVHIVGGMVMFCTLLPLWIYMFRRMTIIKSVTYDKVEVAGKVQTVKQVQYYGPRDDVGGTQFGMILFLMLILTATALVTFS